MAPLAVAASNHQGESVPTVLVAAREELLQALVHLLQLDGYYVFEAKNESEALHVVVSQSRPIHIMVADVDMNGRALAGTLKPYRPEMKTIFVTAHPEGSSDVLTLLGARAKIRELFRLPKGMVVERRLMAGAA